MAKTILFVTFLGIALYSVNSEASGRRVRQQIVYQKQYVYVPQVQQYVAVPVNPYYFSYNAMASHSNVAQTKQQIIPEQRQRIEYDDSQYVTKKEFKEFSEHVIALLEGRELPRPREDDITLQVVSVLEKNCKSCHTAGTEKGNFVMFESGRLREGLGPKEFALFGSLAITGEMPPPRFEMQPVTPEDASLLFKYSNWLRGGDAPDVSEELAPIPDSLPNQPPLPGEPTPVPADQINGR